MSIAKAMLVRAHPYMLRAKAQAILREEMSKGCRPDIAPWPVALEPSYFPILAGENLANLPSQKSSLWVPETSSDENQLSRLRIWLSPQQKCDWVRSELILKQLSCLSHRAALEIVGNEKSVVLQFLCHSADAGLVRTAFKGQFEECELTSLRDNALRDIPAHIWAKAVFADFYPPPPYSHLMTSPEELKRSLYATVITALTEIPLPAIGFFQVAFAPVAPEHNWHQNVEALLDLEFRIKLLGGIAPSQRYLQQTPSGDLRGMASDVETKSHNDKPFFTAALRIGVVGHHDDANHLLHSLALAGSLIQHGGRPLSVVTDTHYRSHLTPEEIRKMFVAGLTYRPGFLVNSWELTSLVHIPPPQVTEPHQSAVVALETLPAGDSLLTGTPVGICSYAGTEHTVCIPPKLRASHTHLIGRTGTGKSSVMESMVLHDVRQGHGVAVLDPHGRLVQRLLFLLPRECVDRVIYINPGDPDWVPIWNPLRCRSAFGPSRIADDLVAAFKSFVTGWGDRLEHLLRHALIGVLHLPQASLLDVSNLLRQKSEESRRLKAMILKIVEDEPLRTFWRHDFDRYGSADLAPPQHKLSKLLTSGAVSLMLSQSDTSFDLRDVMESGKILLIDLSSIGTEVREILGCFILSLLHLTALGRDSLSGEEQRPFHIYCDEAHRFVTDALEDLISETRKFKVSLTLGHQYMDQFTTRKTGALSSVGSTIIFNVDTKDAQHLRKNLQGKVELDDLITLEVGEAIARIGNEVVRVKTHYPLEKQKKHCRDMIIAQSHARYYRPVDVVRRAIRTRGELWQEPLAQFEAHGSSENGHSFDPKDFEYDVF